MDGPLAKPLAPHFWKISSSSIFWWFWYSISIGIMKYVCNSMTNSHGISKIQTENDDKFYKNIGINS